MLFTPFHVNQRAREIVDYLVQKPVVDVDSANCALALIRVDTLSRPNY